MVVEEVLFLQVSSKLEPLSKMVLAPQLLPISFMVLELFLLFCLYSSYP